MNEKILKDYGWCQVIQRDNKFIIRYDAGGIAVKMVENEISKEEAEKALVDQLKAEEIVLVIQRKALGGSKK
ncbi:MAG TPA: hypothetical protein VL728_00980 [Cyclobacteriaceae bacterium]|jgi:hypothetical protein|nr:hypothetical protein [Cyclobacteriaceae bacterium]